MNRLERIHAIDELISRHGTVPVDTFLSSLKISLATFKRDLDYLRSRLNAPLIWDRALGGYRYGSKRRGKAQATQVPALWNGARETHAILLAHSALSQVRSGSLKPETEALCARLAGLLSANGDPPSQILKRLRIADAPSLANDSPFFPLIANAVLKRRKLRLQCAGGRRKSLQTFDVMPQSLLAGADGWALEAQDQSSGKSVVIGLADIESAEALLQSPR